MLRYLAANKVKQFLAMSKQQLVIQPGEGAVFTMLLPLEG